MNLIQTEVINQYIHKTSSGNRMNVLLNPTENKQGNNKQTPMKK